MTKFIILFLATLPCVLNAQEDAINQKVKGKKDGIWSVYLDSSLNKVDNIEAAFFIAFEVFDDGDCIFQFTKHPALEADSVAYSLNWPTKGNPTLLEGVFQWFTNDGRIIEYERYKNGFPSYWKSFTYYKNDPQRCGINEIMDWSKKYEEINGTYRYEVYWDDELHLQGWFRNGKRGWRVYEEKSKR